MSEPKASAGALPIGPGGPWPAGSAPERSGGAKPTDVGARHLRGEIS